MCFPIVLWEMKLFVTYKHPMLSIPKNMNNINKVVKKLNIVIYFS